jgi:hypothetical protein
MLQEHRLKRSGLDLQSGLWSAPKVKNGQVQFKNRWTRTTRVGVRSRGDFVILKEDPGEGYRHLIYAEAHALNREDQTSDLYWKLFPNDFR